MEYLTVGAAILINEYLELRNTNDNDNDNDNE